MSGLLDGVRVLELARVLAGPFGALVLAEMGADVVKVEFPSGDWARTTSPHLGDRSLYFSSVNTGKRGVVLDPASGLGSKARPGKGAHLEAPLLGASLPLLSYMAPAALFAGLDPPKVGSGHHVIPPYGAFEAKDGWIVIAVLADKFWPW